MHKAWKRHQDAVFWVDIDFGIKEGLTFYQTRSNAIILQETLPVYCIPKVVRQNWRSFFLMKKHTCHLDFHQRSHYVTIGQKKLGSKVDRQPEGEVARQAKDDSQVCHEADTLNDDEILRNRMEESIAIHDVSHDVN